MCSAGQVLTIRRASLHARLGSWQLLLWQDRAGLDSPLFYENDYSTLYCCKCESDVGSMQCGLRLMLSVLLVFEDF